MRSITNWFCDCQKGITFLCDFVIICGDGMKVLCAMPESFVRTRGRTNPFFDPIIRVCEENDIEWNLLVPCQVGKTGYNPLNVVDGKVLEFLGLWFWRVVHLIRPSLPSEKVYELLGRVFRPFFGAKYQANIIISVAGQFVEQLIGINPNARVVDLQHGVIYSKHSGYFEKTGRLKLGYINHCNREFWLYGQGYADCFFTNPENAKDLKGRVKVIGDVIRAGESRVEQVAQGEKNLIVIASQMTTDFSDATLAELKKMYEEVFDACPSGKKIVFRHHPRFGNCIDLKDWEYKYRDVVFDDNREWREVFAEAVCLVTVHSTTAFDAAAHGVPTVFLDERRVGWPNVMKGEFEYPYPNMTISELCGMSVADRNEIANNVRKWYAQYYEPFDADRCLKLFLQ